MRRTVPLLASVLVAAAALTLAGCTASGSTSSTSGTATSKGCPAAPSGKESESIKVAGALKKEATVTVPKNLEAPETERTVVDGGKGSAVTDGDSITWAYSLYNGTTGKRIGAQGYSGSAISTTVSTKGQTIVGLNKLLLCTRVGSRVVGVIPPKDAFGTTGSSSLGIGKKDDLVVVADVVSIVKPLVPSTWTENVPKVDLSANPPVVTVPDTAAPANLELVVLKQGTGTVVKTGDSVTVDYQGTNWATKEIFDQSFGKSPATFATTQVVPGFGVALVGQRVGSTVLVTIPPKYGYGTDTSSSSGLGGATLVFLIEIEKTASS